MRWTAPAWGARCSAPCGATCRRRAASSTRRRLRGRALDGPDPPSLWSSTSSLWCARCRCVVCLCGRPYPDSPTPRLMKSARAGYPDRFTGSILLRRRKSAARTLLGNLVGTDVLPSWLAGALLERAGGQSLLPRGAASRTHRSRVAGAHHGVWRLANDPDALAIPDTLQDVITARIDLLEAVPRQVLRLASVIGRDFTFALLEALDEAGIDLARAHRGGSRRTSWYAAAGKPPVASTSFKHALVQEATYESILRPARRDLHARVARTLETLFADRLPDVYSLLAYHYSRAKDWERAQDYLFLAADQAGRIAADAEALEHYRRALAAYGQAFGDRWDPVDRAAIERRMGEALFHLGSHGQARHHLDRAVAALGHPMPESPGGAQASGTPRGRRSARPPLDSWLAWWTQTPGARPRESRSTVRPGHYRMDRDARISRPPDVGPSPLSQRAKTAGLDDARARGVSCSSPSSAC